MNGAADVEVIDGAITANNFSLTIYVDGVAASIIDTDWHYVVISTSTGINANAVDIGKIDTGYFDGKLDEVRFYDYALSADEIGQLYRMGMRRMEIRKE